MYSCNWLLGEPSICGWITPAMALVIVYLEGFADPGYAAAVAALGEEAVTAAGGGMQALLQSGNQEYIQIAHNTTTLRMQAMAATELELGILFIILGVHRPFQGPEHPGSSGSQGRHRPRCWRRCCACPPARGWRS